MFHEVIRVYQVGFSHAIVYSSLPKSEHASSIQQRILDNVAESEVIYIKSCSLETSHGAIIALIVILKHYAVFHSFLHNSIMLFCGGYCLSCWAAMLFHLSLRMMQSCCLLFCVFVNIVLVGLCYTALLNVYRDKFRLYENCVHTV